jgi:predicted site-specific integrase-resolvase
MELFMDAQMKYFPILGGEKKGLIDSKEAMKRLGISSMTTMKKIRDEGRIEFIKLNEKKIMYEEVEIERFIKEHSKRRF